MNYDHDFISIQDCITSVIPVLYIDTGCDYISFFKGHTKPSFFDTFSKHVDFFSGGKFPFHGKLNQVKDQWELGFFVFFEISRGKILSKMFY